MPRKSKITAVPIEPSEQPAEVIEEKTDAEQMTDVINQVAAVTPETLEPIAPSEPVVLKAKAKRASRAKPKEGPKEEPKEEPNEEPKEEPKEEQKLETISDEAKAEAKADVKVTCPDCGKHMSAKTLKYSHTPNCTAKKQNDTPTPHTRQRESVMEEVIENEVQKRLQNKRSERAARREEMVQNLMKNAF